MNGVLHRGTLYRSNRIKSNERVAGGSGGTVPGGYVWNCVLLAVWWSAWDKHHVMLNSIEEVFAGGKNSKRTKSRKMNSGGPWRLLGFEGGEVKNL